MPTVAQPPPWRPWRARRGCCLPLLLLPLLGLLLAAGAAAVRDRLDQASITGMPVVQQTHHLSCEYAATAAVTRFWGRPLTEADFIREIPRDPNPHVGFRGDIDAAWGGTDNYGIYAEPLVPVLERHGFRAVALYTGPDRLKAEVAAGHPVVVWITGRPGLWPRITESAAGRSFSLTPYEHALVVYGYTPDQVQVMDVGAGELAVFSWPDFLDRWSYFDAMALVVTPGW